MRLCHIDGVAADGILPIFMSIPDFYVRLLKHACSVEHSIMTHLLDKADMA